MDDAHASEHLVITKRPAASPQTKELTDPARYSSIFYKLGILDRSNVKEK